MTSLQQKQKQSNFRLQLLVAGVSVILLVAKFIAYVITNSVAVLTDALESIVNAGAALIGLYSLYVSAKPRDLNHPYGHGKAEFVSSAVEGGLILAAGAIIIYKSIRTFFEPVELELLETGMVIVGGTALVNWFTGLLAIRQGKRNHSIALVSSGSHLQTDSYSTLGIIIGLLLISLTGLTWLDPLLAIGFGGFVIYTGYRIIRESLAGIMDEADMSLLSKMVEKLNESKTENWVDVHNLRVIKYGTVLHVDCHLTVPWYFNVSQAHEEVDKLAHIIRTDFGDALELFVHSDGCKYFQCHICEKAACHVRQEPFEKRIEWDLNNLLQNERHGKK
jgi:cation diffusion facilitator family transporter